MCCLGFMTNIFLWGLHTCLCGPAEQSHTFHQNTSKVDLAWVSDRHQLMASSEAGRNLYDTENGVTWAKPKSPKSHFQKKHYFIINTFGFSPARQSISQNSTRKSNSFILWSQTNITLASLTLCVFYVIVSVGTQSTGFRLYSSIVQI